MTKKVLAVLLAVILLAQAAPLTVLAAEETENEPEGTEKIIKLGEPAEENAFESGGRKTAAETSGTAPVQRSREAVRDSGRKGAAKPSAEDLRRRIDEIPKVTQLYETEPVISGPGYRPAVLTEAAYANALGWVNYYRTAAGLREVSFTDELNLSASWGALCLAMGRQFTHNPERPEDMSEEDFEKGRTAAAGSNLSWSWGYGPGEILQEAVAGQIDDSDMTNLSALGHRRWLLDPRIRTMGVGVADSDGYYTNIRVMGNGVSTQAAADYDFIAWPASGNNLTETFRTDAPWSITLNPSRYETPDPDTVKVTLTRKSDGRTWTFSSAADISAAGEEYDYYSVNSKGYGIANCIIFRPACSGLPPYSGVYTVDVTGLSDRDGNGTELHYSAVFSSYGADGNRQYEMTGWFWEDDWSAAWATFSCVGEPSVSMTLEAAVTGPEDGVFTAAVTGPDGHTYTCSVKAFEPPAFKSQSVVLTGEIGVNFFLELPTDYCDFSDSYMTFRIGSGSAEQRDGFDPNHMNSARTRYGFTCYVTSIQMADAITATFHYGDGKSVSKTYSVAQYIDSVEKNQGSYSAKTIALVHALADYGHYAQLYLADINGWTIGEDYAAMTAHYAESFDYASILTEVRGMAFDKSGIAGSNVEKATYKLHLDSKTTLDVYLTPQSGTELTASAVFNGRKYEAVKQSNGRYLVRIPDIPAHRLGEMITVTGTAGNAFSVKVSALSYVRSVLNSSASGRAAKDCLSALYSYYAAVRAYRS